MKEKKRQLNLKNQIIKNIILLVEVFKLYNLGRRIRKKIRNFFSELANLLLLYYIYNIYKTNKQTKKYIFKLVDPSSYHTTTKIN